MSIVFQNLGIPSKFEITHQLKMMVPEYDIAFFRFDVVSPEGRVVLSHERAVPCIMDTVTPLKWSLVDDIVSTLLDADSDDWRLTALKTPEWRGAATAGTSDPQGFWITHVAEDIVLGRCTVRVYPPRR
jgi:hypothetical protein